MFRARSRRSQPNILPFMHNVRLVLAKFDRAGPLHNFFRHDVTPFVRPQEKERVIGIHPSTIAKPADAAVRNELMHPAHSLAALHFVVSSHASWHSRIAGDRRDFVLSPSSPYLMAATSCSTST